jgi:Fic family protein
MNDKLPDYDFSAAVGYHHGRFPPTELDLARMIGPLGTAREALARYDQMLKTLRNSALMLAPMRRQEAVVSSRMEGTITTLDALLQFEAEEGDARRDGRHASNDTLETYLYAQAMREAEDAIRSGYDLSDTLIRNMHATLLRSGRGRDKRPGEFKSEQNYIADRLRKRVMFVPIEPISLAAGLDAFHEYSLNGNTPDPLIRLAISHAEFEALHPFDDGNGRIGRMLVTLMLWREGMIEGPHFFLSSYFEREKDEYIDRLRKVSFEDDWSGWCAFFLEAIAEAARESLRTAENVSRLYEDMREEFRAATGSQWHGAALDFVFESPVFTKSAFVRRLVEQHGVSGGTPNRFVNELVRRGTLSQIRPASGRAPAILAFDPLLQLLRV